MNHSLSGAWGGGALEFPGEEKSRGLGLEARTGLFQLKTLLPPEVGRGWLEGRVAVPEAPLGCFSTWTGASEIEACA